MARRRRSTGSALALAVLAGLVIAVTRLWPDLVDSAAAQPSWPKIEVAKAEVAAAERQLGQLKVRFEDTGHPYSREDWPHWSEPHRIKVRGKCDARELALARDGENVERDGWCAAVSGRWVSDYDGAETSDSSRVDVDHIVALAEANRSHTRRWGTAQRQALANAPGNLWSVSASSNRTKSDDDPGSDGYRPPNRGVWCQYAVRWIDVKTDFKLTADPDEVAGLRAMLRYC